MTSSATRIFAIDPGPVLTAWVSYRSGALVAFGHEPNRTVLERLQGMESFSHDHAVIEMIACYGMAVGAEVFRTCLWIGRYAQVLEDKCVDTHLLERLRVKMALCHTPNAKDGNVRQALIDRFGGSKEAAIGNKKQPGPLYGVANDVWAALAVAVAFSDGATGELI